MEKDLCAQLNVSRTSLREALRQLQAEGILTDTTGRGVAVVQVSRDDAENIYRIRSVLEALIVGQFVEKANEADLADLHKKADMLKAAYRSGDVERIVAGKRAFYDRICSGANRSNRLRSHEQANAADLALASAIRERKERQKQSIAEIDTIMAAIESRDVVAAKAAAERHVLNRLVSALPFA